MKPQKLTELFPIQAKLDETIAINHPIQDGEDRLKKVKVALLVELGEAMNEYRKFKFWSTDQKERRERLLEELVDCLHFLLSIGLRLGVQDELFIHPAIWFKETPEQAFIDLMTTDSTEYYEDAFGLFYVFYDSLGFKTEDLYNGYFEKNAINHKRQEQGY